MGENDWLSEALPDEGTDLESYLGPKDEGSGEGEFGPVVPGTVGILPVRNTVVYPGTVTPLTVGRERSKALLADIEPDSSLIGLVTQRNPDTDRPGFGQLHKIGTAASVLKIIKMPQGSVNIFVHGIARFKIVKPVATDPYLKAKVETLPIKIRMTKQLQALMVSVRQSANRIVALSPSVSEEASVWLENIEDPSSLADFLAANLNIDVSKKQELLEELNPSKRLKEISVILAHQLEVLELSHKIQGRVRDSVDKSQREYFLQEQLKAIQSELGQQDGRTEELKELRQSIAKAKMPKAAEAEALRELDRLSKIPSASPEYSVIRTYLDWVCELPWSVHTEDRIDISQAERILNRDHYDLKKIKQRILEFLAVRKLNPKGKSPILCFIGPPGVGKTSLGKSIARAMGRKFVRVSLGGIRDEADIRGHRRTYIGALPGRVMQELRKCQQSQPGLHAGRIGQDRRRFSRRSVQRPAGGPGPRAKRQLHRPLSRPALRSIGGHVHRHSQLYRADPTGAVRPDGNNRTARLYTNGEAAHRQTLSGPAPDQRARFEQIQADDQRRGHRRDYQQLHP